MTHTDFFAKTTLHEVGRKGDPSKGLLVALGDRIEGISTTDLIR